MDRSRQPEIVLNEDEQRLYDRLGPLFEQEQLRMARHGSNGRAVVHLAAEQDDLR